MHWRLGAAAAGVVFGLAVAAPAQDAVPVQHGYTITTAPGTYRLTTASRAYHLAMMPAAAAEGQNGNDAAVKDDLFTGTDNLAKNATHVTEITMDPDSLNMVGGRDSAKARSMVLNVVRTYTYDKPGMYNMADVDAIRNRLNTGDWHCSVHMRDLKTGAGQDVCSKRRTDGLREDAVIEVEAKELTFIHRIWRPNGPGSSELSGLPMIFPGMGGLPMMAMMDPEALAEMQIGKVQMQMALQGMPLDLNDFKVNPQIDEKQMMELDKELKDLKVDPEIDEKQLQDQLKDLKPLQKDKRHFLLVVPDEDSAPQPAAKP